MRAPMFSVVIPTHNRKHLLRRCLRAVLAQDYPHYEVIVVDDGSTDGTGEMVLREFPSVRYIRQEVSRGPAAARNRGIEAASGEIIAFTDDDCLVPESWLHSHRQYYEDPRVGGVGGLQITASPNFVEQFQISHYLDIYTQFRRVSHPTEARGFGTNNLSVRKEVFDRAGLFDEAFITGSDPEFVRRALAVGYIFIQDPNLRVEHLRVDTWRSYLRTRFRRGCGSVLTDIKYDTLSVRRFLPLINPVSAWRTWRNFQRVRGSARRIGDLPCFWSLIILSRLAEVAGRTYYYFKVGRHYVPHPKALPYSQRSLTDEGQSVKQ